MNEVWKLVRSRRWPLAGSFLLMIVERFCSFAAPISSRYLINNVMYQHQLDKLPLIVGVVALVVFRKQQSEAPTAGPDVARSYFRCPERRNALAAFFGLSSQTLVFSMP